jgi:hypothetical protein
VLCRKWKISIKAIIHLWYHCLKPCGFEFEHFVEVRPHKLLQPSHTRWLSLHSIGKKYNFLPIENLYLGANVTASISNNTSSLNLEELLTFRKRCLEFLIEGCHQMYKRFDPNNQSTQTLKQLTVISPREVISKQHDSIAPLASNFPNLIASDQLNSLDTELRMLRNVGLSNLNDLNIGEFWQRISHMRQIEPVSIFQLTMNC